MVDDFTVGNAITEILDFHLGIRVWDDLFDPVEDGCFGGHGTGSAGFLYHKKSWINNNLSNEIQLSLKLIFHLIN